MRQLVLLLILFVTVSCSNDQVIVNNDADYKSPSNFLHIAVIGDEKLELVENVRYDRISLPDLSIENTKDYDGIIVTSDRLDHAAELKYRDFFTNTTIPVFFFGAEQLMVTIFTDKDYGINDFHPEHGAYVTGYVNEGSSYRTWDLYLENNPTEYDKTTDMLLRIFDIIESRSAKADAITN